MTRIDKILTVTSWNVKMSNQTLIVKKVSIHVVQTQTSPKLLTATLLYNAKNFYKKTMHRVYKLAIPSKNLWFCTHLKPS